MSDQPIAEVIGWTPYVDPSDVEVVPGWWVTPEGGIVSREPSVDDLAAWLGDRLIALVVVRGTTNYCTVEVRLPTFDCPVSGPTILAALEAAVRRVAAQ